MDLRPGGDQERSEIPDEVYAEALEAITRAQQGGNWRAGIAVAYRAGREEAARRVLEIHTEHEGRCTHCAEFCDCLDKVGYITYDCRHGNVEWPCPTVLAVSDKTAKEFRQWLSGVARGGSDG